MTTMTDKQSWQEVVDRKLAQRTEALSKFADTKATTAVTDEDDIGGLRKQIASGDVTVEAVITDYIAKCVTHAPSHKISI